MKVASGLGSAISDVAAALVRCTAHAARARSRRRRAAGWSVPCSRGRAAPRAPRRNQPPRRGGPQTCAIRRDQSARAAVVVLAAHGVACAAAVRDPARRHDRPGRSAAHDALEASAACSSRHVQRATRREWITSCDAGQQLQRLHRPSGSCTMRPRISTSSGRSVAITPAPAATAAWMPPRRQRQVDRATALGPSAAVRASLELPLHDCCASQLKKRDRRPTPLTQRRARVARRRRTGFVSPAAGQPLLHATAATAARSAQASSKPLCSGTGAIRRMSGRASSQTTPSPRSPRTRARLRVRRLNRSATAASPPACVPADVSIRSQSRSRRRAPPAAPRRR